MSTQNIKKINKKISRCLEEILSIKEMLRGRYAVTYTTCGKPNCRCAKGEKHSHARLTWNEKGKHISRTPPAEDVNWVVESTEAYRNFKELKAKLSQLQSSLITELSLWAETSVKKTRRKKRYLIVKK